MNTRLALTVWKGRLSPVFDVACAFIFLDISNKLVTGRREERFDGIDSIQKVNKLGVLGVNVLICGAVSRHLFEMLEAKGIKVFPFIAGDVEDVIAAYINGKLSAPALAMPGCCGRMRKGRIQGQGRRGCGRQWISESVGQ